MLVGCKGARPEPHWFPCNSDGACFNKSEHYSASKLRLFGVGIYTRHIYISAKMGDVREMTEIVTASMTPEYCERCEDA